MKKDRKKNVEVEDQIFETLRSKMATKRARKRRKLDTQCIKAYVDIDIDSSATDSEEDSDVDGNSND